MKAKLAMIVAALLAQVAVASATDIVPEQKQVVPPNTQPDNGATAISPNPPTNPGTVGSGSRTISPEGAKNDPHTLGGKDVPIPDPTRPTMAPTQGR